MLRIELRHMLIASSLLLVGCNQPADTALEKKLEATNAQVASLKKQLEQQSQTVAVNQMVANLDKFAYLTPGSEGYSPVKFDLGYLTVQLTDVKPYANGSKVILRFGNVLSASINGLKTNIDWGKVDAKGMVIDESTKTKEMTFSQVLRAASWTPIPVVLEGIPPNELGFVRVHDITHTGINLFK